MTCLAFDNVIESLIGRLALFGPHQQIDLVKVIAGAQQLLHKGLAKETGGACYKY